MSDLSRCVNCSCADLYPTWGAVLRCVGTVAALVAPLCAWMVLWA